MRFYGEYCFLDVIPLDEAKPEYGVYEKVSDYDILYAVYITPYEGDNRRHHDAPDHVFGHVTPGGTIGPWDKGEKVNEQKE